MPIAEHIHIDGIVQGVGFRPFVYRLAREYDLKGWVRNNSRGVDIEVSGTAKALDAFVRTLSEQAPPLAQIDAITRAPLPHTDLGAEFIIIHSEDEGGFTLVSPDTATCPDCLRELFEPANRRYRYPFTNCTNCGPRFSIIQALPYDRPNTTMSAFPMCADCQNEYENPLDRRFHAQPNACPECGPHIWLEQNGLSLERDKAMRAAAQTLLDGSLLAVKGLGGFHLVCDATNTQAVRTLRKRKPRPHKPLAVMMRNLEMVRAYCHLSADEEDMLTSPAAPIMLLAPRPGTDLSLEIAPRQRALGVMLPYTPLHHLLLHDVNRPLVMTSGNRQNEPIARTNEQARKQLGSIVDGFLWHNRDIHNRNDDSVWMVTAEGPVPLRRSRGYAPRPIVLQNESPVPVLATGSQMKNTFCLLTGNQAFLSQHIGEMDYFDTWQFFTESVRRYQDLFGIHPKVIAHDMHPDFTLAAQDVLNNLLPGALTVPVQHHHAHIASCLAENGVDGPVIGLAFDGTGYGPDGTIWGGEFLIADTRTYRRAAHLGLFPLPGGEQAIRDPRRIALGLLLKTFGNLPGDLDLVQNTEPVLQQTVKAQIERGLNAPLTSSCGRLFDAVAALIGLRERVTYEGQAAIELETLALDAPDAPRYPLNARSTPDGWTLPPEPLIRQVVADLRSGISPAVIAARFHQTVIAAARRLVINLHTETGLDAVALSGGCFQNRILLEGLSRTLRADGLTVYTHHRVPPNDGGLSPGQAIIAASHSL